MPGETWYETLSFWLLVIGGLNWGLTVFGFNLVTSIFGTGMITNLIYVLVGISAIVQAITYFNN